MTRSAFLLGFALLFVGCGSGDGGADADADTDGDVDADTDTDTDTDSDVDCGVGDTECPETHPHPGGPCEGVLDCPYSENGYIGWRYTCVDGAWDAENVQCDIDGGGCTPPLVERCDDPFDGELDGATVAVGPTSVSEPFRPFSPDDELRLIWGPQGAPMVEFRFHLEGADDLECVLARFVLRDPDEGSSEPTVDRVRLHCEDSLSVFAIVPFENLGCRKQAGTLDLEIEVEVQGVGVGSGNVRVAYDAMEHCTFG